MHVSGNIRSSEFAAVLCGTDESVVDYLIFYSCRVFSHHKHKHYGKLIQVVYMLFYFSLSLDIDLKSTEAECLN